jgi:hypothetical protein
MEKSASHPFRKPLGETLREDTVTPQDRSSRTALKPGTNPRGVSNVSANWDKTGIKSLASKQALSHW